MPEHEPRHTPGRDIQPEFRGESAGDGQQRHKVRTHAMSPLPPTIPVLGNGWKGVRDRFRDPWSTEELL
jgi:hypothetical protein